MLGKNTILEKFEFIIGVIGVLRQEAPKIPNNDAWAKHRRRKLAFLLSSQNNLFHTDSFQNPKMVFMVFVAGWNYVKTDDNSRRSE